MIFSVFSNCHPSTQVRLEPGTYFGGRQWFFLCPYELIFKAKHLEAWLKK
jgi:hypothetical protein